MCRRVEMPWLGAVRRVDRVWSNLELEFYTECCRSRLLGGGSKLEARHIISSLCREMGIRKQETKGGNQREQCRIPELTGRLRSERVVQVSGSLDVICPENICFRACRPLGGVLIAQPEYLPWPQAMMASEGPKEFTSRSFSRIHC
jgi:hypothetical protein